MVVRRPSFRYQAVITLLSIIMVLTLLESLDGFWRVQTPSNELFLFASAGAVYGWLWWRSSWLGAGTTMLGVIVAIAAILYVPEGSQYLLTVAEEAREFVLSLRQDQMEATFGPAIGQVFLITMAAGTSLLIITDSLGRGNTFWSLVAGVFIFGTQWAWYYDRSLNYFMPYAILAFANWTLSQAARRDANWEGSGRKVGYRSHVMTPLAALVAVAVLAAMLPTNIAPLDLGAWGERAQEAFPVLKRLRGSGAGGSGGRFSLARTGFSPTFGTLGGPVALDNTVALHMTTTGQLQQTLYLRGATFSVYDGQTWQPGELVYTRVPPDGNLTSSLGSDVLKEYVTVRISPALDLGNTVFGLLEPMRVDGLKSPYRADRDGNLWAEKAIPKGASYELSARIPTYSAEQIRLLSTSSPNESYQPYLAVPETLPKRVGELALGLTDNYTHPYDKAVAIEAWLRGMQYNLDVPTAPQGRDFVDFFLFDLRSGYCTYYSTAMSVMLRELGIATRLVEGFAVPPGAQRTEGNNGKYTYPALNSMAHAWVEAYFPGYGWVTFDPTPRADLPVIDRSIPAPRPESNQPSNSSNNSGSSSGDELNENERRLKEMDQGETGSYGSASSARNEWPSAVSLLLAVAAVAALSFRRLKAQDRISASEERQVVQEAWSKTSWLMSLFSFERKPHETPREYAESLGTKWPALKASAVQVAEDYTVARYAPMERHIDPEAANRARALWIKVHEVLFKRFGWRKYLWQRLRWRRRSTDV